MACFVEKDVNERAVALCEFLCDLDCDIELPADCSGGFCRLKIRAADFVGTAPLRLFKSTRCILPGTDGQDATPRSPSGCEPGVPNLARSWRAGA